MTTSSQAAIRESLREEAQEGAERHGRRKGWNDAIQAALEVLERYDAGQMMKDAVRDLRR